MVASGRPGEFELIERYFRPLATAAGAFGLTDDAAQLSPRPGEDLVVTTDLLAAGVHFFADDPPASIARKALRVNLSDLAAKGAEPAVYFLSLALAENWTEDWIAAFTAALGEDQARYGVSLLGGDTSRAASGTTLSITAIGRLPAGSMVRRAGAQAGDAVVVSGTVGDAALGLRIRLGTLDPALAGSGAAHLLDRYLHPQPRTGLAPLLRRDASSALDVSDGLMGDLAHICTASAVGAEVDATAIPLSRPARALAEADPSALASILGGGDDYEILATLPPGRVDGFVAAAAAVGVPVRMIGRIVSVPEKPTVRGADGRLIDLGRAGHTHF